MNTSSAIEKTLASFRAPFENHCLLCARARKKAYNLLNLTKAPAIFSKYSPAPAARAATSAQFGLPSPPGASSLLALVCPALALTIAWQQREPTNLAQCKFVFALNLTKLIKLNTRVHRQTCTNNDKRSQPRQTEPGAREPWSLQPARSLPTATSLPGGKIQIRQSAHTHTHSVRELCE